MGQSTTEFRCKLVVWEKAVQLCTATYLLTQKFPREEVYGLTNQLRRASVSIPSNIAEGYGRGTREQYKQFLSIAFGSYMELQTQLTIAVRLGFLGSSEFEKVEGLASEVGKMLSAILIKLRSPSNP
jgi:four helix bundle protein